MRLLAATCTANGVQKFILSLVRYVCVVFSDHLYVMVCTVSMTNCKSPGYIPATVFLLNASLLLSLSTSTLKRLLLNQKNMPPRAGLIYASSAALSEPASEPTSQLPTWQATYCSPAPGRPHLAAPSLVGHNFLFSLRKSILFSLLATVRGRLKKRKNYQ